MRSFPDVQCASFSCPGNEPARNAKRADNATSARCYSDVSVRRRRSRLLRSQNGVCAPAGHASAHGQVGRRVRREDPRARGARASRRALPNFGACEHAHEGLGRAEPDRASTPGRETSRSAEEHPDNNTPEASQRYAEACAADWDAGRAVRFGVRDRATRALVGVVGLDSCVHLHRSCELGYWLRLDATGRGLMTESAKACVDFALSRLGVHRIRCAAATDNYPSLRVIAIGIQIRRDCAPSGIRGRALGRSRGVRTIVDGLTR